MNRPLRLPLLAALAWLAYVPAAAVPQQTVAAPPAAEPQRPTLRAYRLPGPPPIIDGRLDDAAWEGAEVAGDFTQREPDEGAPASERTEVRIAYDAHAIYVAARMYDSAPDSIVASLTRRDNQIQSDWFHVSFDSYFDRRTAFVFGVNARGVKQDMTIVNDRQYSTTWDAVWDAAVQIDSLGWTAEFRIPFSQLRFGTRDGEQVWGLQFRRRLQRRNEFAWWSPLPRNAAGDVSFYGTLTGLELRTAPRRLEIVPYSVGRLTRAPQDAGNPLYRPNHLVGSFGADIKYGLTSNLTLNATFNPDFGQVEADPSEVNLTAFETRFAERRPLFVEGADIFQREIGEDWWGGEQLFYSRRIGRAPQRRVSVPGGFVDAPTATTLLSAVKLSGKTPGGWSLGVLDVVTAREQARVVTAEGEEENVVVEPLTNYGVASVRRDFRAGQSAVGGIFTSTHRRLENEPDLQFLRSAAYAGGVDVRHRFGGGNYEAKASVMGSHIRGSEDAIARAQRSSVRFFHRPDADHLTYDSTRTSLTGTGAAAYIGKSGGGHWRWAVDGLVRSPGFEVNDLGFQRQADRLSASGFVGYEQFRPGKVLRRWRSEVFPVAQWTFGGERLESLVGTHNTFQHLDYWGGWFGMEYSFDGLSTDLLRGGPAVRTPPRVGAWAGLYSDARRKLNARMEANASLEQETDASFLRLAPSLTYRPSGRTELSLTPAAAWNTVPWQFIAERGVAGQREYLVGRLDQTTVSLTARVNYTFRPDLSFQLYAQPFVSAGEYTAFQRLQDARAASVASRFRRFAPNDLAYDAEARLYRADLNGDGVPDLSFPDRDFNVKELRTNSVLRWEFRPGSTLFVVWSQGRSASDVDGSFRLRRDTNRLFAADETNVLLIKLSYWLNR